MYFDKLDDTVNKFINTYHKVKPVDVKTSIYIDFNYKNNKKSLKLKFGDNVTISKYKSIFAKSYVLNLSEKNFVITKILKEVLKGEEVVETSCEKDLVKANRKEFRIEKVIMRK